MIYNFDEIIERRGTNSTKWDLGEKDVIPMWIADMDFKTAQPIIDALKMTVEQELYGYSIIPDEYYESINSWFYKRHNWNIEKEWIIPTTGVVPILGLLARTLTKPGDKIIIQSPVYQSFYKAITDNGGEVVDNPLKLEAGKYVIDYEDLENKASDDKVKMFILCSPHNPIGRVWSRDELTKLGEICIRHNVLLVSDEIHCDFIYKGNKHIPFASINKEFEINSVTCIAPSKTFNLAGLKVSNVIVSNEELKEKINKAVSIGGLSRLNIFATGATVAAYKYGEDWLEQLVEYLEGNVDYITEFVKNELPILEIIKPEATYLMWIDCSKLNIKERSFNDFFLKEARVWINEGGIFGHNGEGFIRINIACPRSILEAGLKRIKRAIYELKV